MTRVPGSRTATLRLRIGVTLIVLSWCPFPQIYIWIKGLTGEDASDARLVGWTIQFIVGFIGLAFAGAAAKAVVNRVGWRRLPKTLWSMLRTGQVPDTPEPSTEPPAEPPSTEPPAAGLTTPGQPPA